MSDTIEVRVVEVYKMYETKIINVPTDIVMAGTSKMDNWIWYSQEGKDERNNATVEDTDTALEAFYTSHILTKE